MSSNDIERAIMEQARTRTYWHAVYDDESVGGVYTGTQEQAESVARETARKNSRKSSYNPDGTLKLGKRGLNRAVCLGHRDLHNPPLPRRVQ